MLLELQADFVYSQKTAQQKVAEFREAGLFVPQSWKRKFQQQEMWLGLQTKLHEGVMSI